jgi:hypothetical protein
MLYGSLTLREEHRLRVFKNNVLRKVFGLTMDKMGEVHNRGPYAVYSSPNIIWEIKSGRMRGVGHVACMGDGRGSCMVLVGIPRHRWEGNIKMYHQEVKWGGGGIYLIAVAQGRGSRWMLVNMVMNLLVP